MKDKTPFKVGELVVFNDLNKKEIKEIEIIISSKKGTLILLDYDGEKYFRLAKYYRYPTEAEIKKEQIRKLFIA